MKINCGPTRADRRKAKLARLGEWHEWFAWHPVRLLNEECRWLETVERRGSETWGGGDYGYWQWQYLPLSTTPKGAK